MTAQNCANDLNAGVPRTKFLINGEKTRERRRCGSIEAAEECGVREKAVARFVSGRVEPRAGTASVTLAPGRRAPAGIEGAGHGEGVGSVHISGYVSD